MNEDTREHWRAIAYRLQGQINQLKVGPRLGTLPDRPEPPDSGRGDVKDWRRMCTLLTRYKNAYSTRRPPALSLITDLEKLRAKLWD